MSAQQPITDREAWAHVARVVKQAQSSFIWGMRILPAKRRRAIYALYAFSREVDNIVDEPGDPAVKREALAGWRTEIENLYAGIPSHPVTHVLLKAVDAFELPKEEFAALIDGMETDAAPALRFAGMDNLLTYCRRVAGSVGVLCIHIFGASQAPGPAMAVELGQAFQLTNILRDLAEDAKRNRLYVPQSMLDTYGIPGDCPATALRHPGITAVCENLAALAWRSYNRADELMSQLGWWRMRPPALMRTIYQPLLSRMEQRGWTRLEKDVSMTKLQKTGMILRYGLR